MSLQWSLIAAILYVEIAIVLLMVLPIFSAKRLHKIIKSKILQALSAQAGWYFGFFLLILALFFVDAIREMRKYSSFEVKETHGHLDAEMQNNMKLFRAQRNFYISGFALFLWLVIRQLVSLIASQATLLAQNEAAIRQASGAAKAAQQLLDTPRENDSDEIKRLKESIVKKEEEIEKLKTDFKALQSQAESLTKEYDRLLKEHEKIQKQVEASGDKKDE